MIYWALPALRDSLCERVPVLWKKFSLPEYWTDKKGYGMITNMM